MKLRSRDKFAIVVEVLREASAGGLFMLISTLMFLLWALFSGTAQIISTLPNWALAIGACGAIVICITALVIKVPKMIYVSLSAVALLAIQIGCGAHPFPNTSNRIDPLIFLVFQNWLPQSHGLSQSALL